MKELEVTVVAGRVTSFDSATSRGKVSLQDGGEVEFHSTAFQSMLPTRFPQSGDTVRVTFDDGHMVSVRSAPQLDK